MSEANRARRGRVYLRGSTWWVDFSHRGRRYREPAETAKTERQAWDVLESLREAARQGQRLDIERARFSHLAERLRRHYEAKGVRPRTLARWSQVLAHLEGFFGPDLAREVADRLDAYVVHRREQKAAPATIRLELGLLSTAFKVARLPRPDLPTIEVRNVRQGFLEAAEVACLAERLPEPLRAPVWFAFYTGWRKAEVLGLEWRNVDLAAGIVRLEPGMTKSGRGRVFPVGAHPDLARLLTDQQEAARERQRATGRVLRWVFHREGEPILDMDDAWRSAVRRAGLPGRLFHDLRRSAALNLRRLGLSESDIMEMCGWETRAMFQRYAIRDERGLADRLSRALSAARSGTTSAQTVR